MEKNVKRISVRVPPSWKIKAHERNLPISQICRSALWQAICTSDNQLENAGKIHSLQQATALFNSLSELRVRTITPDLEYQLREKAFKTLFFRSILQQKADARQLITLGEFLDQGSYAEEVLQQVFK